MKKLITIFTLCLLLCSAGFSESKNRGLSLAGLWQCDNNLAGGSLEIGFPLTKLEDKGFLLRNNFIFSGKGGDGIGFMSLGDKIIIGGFVDNNNFAVSPYGFITSGIGLYSGHEKSLLQLPIIIEFSFGGGFELQFSKYSAFLIEYGGTFPIITENEYSGFLKSSPCLTLGYRTYL